MELDDATGAGVGTEFARPLAGMVSIVTGGGQGIGREFACAFAQAGAKVVVADLNYETAEGVAKELRALGHEATALTVDVGDEASVREMVAQTLSMHGRIDVLLNNAAIFSTLTMKPFDEIELDEWRRVLDVNLTGVFLCCRWVGKSMKERNSGGSIINVSSATVLSGRPNYLHYVASKAGVVGLTRALARELGAAGVTVNVLMPGSVDTGVPRDSIRAGQAEQIVAGQSIKRRLVSDDIVGAAVFLASTGSRALTGQSIVIDGGMNFL
ncbi:SDR family NAD(P)-dependent oxidoreductase [uncultured Arthrobacter sp.]|uniref:SDR family NAD(P)-dependent oxidoreductase n=1 Tax=uncultured Arthrobacter sp. TaxID=114050 RepID=UPI0025CDBD40|nr:SDR family NAD(P)-dependent oxidoreductase [uncultured Arthrobacter sp.]